MSAKVKKIAVILLGEVLCNFEGTVISGGTTVGVPGCVGAVAEKLGAQRRFRLLGYAPKMCLNGNMLDDRYDEIIEVGQDDYSSEQILCYWTDILSAGITCQSVQLVGLGGGPVSGIEYRIALAMGASVGIVEGTGGVAETLLGDGLWGNLPNLYRLPIDPQVVSAFISRHLSA